MKEETVETLARITTEGPDFKEWSAAPASNAIENWYKQKKTELSNQKENLTKNVSPIMSVSHFMRKTFVFYRNS